jgi:hypothetical protein
LTRRIPAASSGFKAGRLTAPKRTLMVEDARFFGSGEKPVAKDDGSVKGKRGSEQYYSMNSRISRFWTTSVLRRSDRSRSGVREPILSAT